MRYQLLLYDRPAQAITVLEDETTVVLPRGTLCVCPTGFLHVPSDKPVVATTLFDVSTGLPACGMNRSVEIKPEEVGH